MHILRLLRRCSQPRANGPDRLVSDHCLGKGTDTQLLNDTAKLTRDNLKSFSGFTLLQGLPYAQHRSQATCLCRCELADQHCVLLPQNLAALGMPDKHQGTTCIHQLTRCNFTSQRTLS
ncbi:hypothetical protein D3C71_1442210 [compost metagenome]